MVDGDRRVAARGHRQITGPLLARGIHAVADRRPQRSRVRPFIEDAIGQSRKEALDLVLEAAMPVAVKELKRHKLDQESWMYRLLAISSGVVAIFYQSQQHFHLR